MSSKKRDHDEMSGNQSNVLGMIEHYLREHGYDGLYNPRTPCACEVGDLAPCGGDYIAECLAGYKQPGCDDDCGLGCDWHIGASRPNRTPGCAAPDYRKEMEV